jgi:Txe/YoeB family toxin of Txe-Axe toxin-antitoxin module
MLHIQDFYALEYYNKQRTAQGDIVQYIAKRIKHKHRFLITVQNNVLLKVEPY